MNPPRRGRRNAIEIYAGRIFFGADDAKPLLGVTALASVGITVDPANRTLKRLPGVPLK